MEWLLGFPLKDQALDGAPALALSPFPVSLRPRRTQLGAPNSRTSGPLFLQSCTRPSCGPHRRLRCGYGYERATGDAIPPILCASRHTATALRWAKSAKRLAGIAACQAQPRLARCAQDECEREPFPAESPSSPSPQEVPRPPRGEGPGLSEIPGPAERITADRARDDGDRGAGGGRGRVRGGSAAAARTTRLMDLRRAFALRADSRDCRLRSRARVYHLAA